MKSNNTAQKTVAERPFFEHGDSSYFFARMEKEKRRLVFLEAMRSFFEDEW